MSEDRPIYYESYVKHLEAEVERLRREEAEIYGQARREFAAEIKRLKEELRFWTDPTFRRVAVADLEDQNSEIERLRSENKKLRGQ